MNKGKYYITTAIIEKIILDNCQIDEMIIMVQKEVALKMTSDYKNPLLLMIEDIGKIEYLFTVNKSVFLPAPHVDSAIIKIILNKKADLKLYDVLNVCFKQRRKTILNNRICVFICLFFLRVTAPLLPAPGHSFSSAVGTTRHRCRPISTTPHGRRIPSALHFPTE